MKKTFELLGNEISNHFDDPLLCNRIAKALSDAYEDGKTEGPNKLKIYDPFDRSNGLFRGKPFGYWIDLEAQAKRFGLIRSNEDEQ